MPNPDPVGPSSPPRRLRARAVVVALAAGTAAALGAAERADAGDYVVTQCSSVTPFVQASWERSSDHYRSRALCGTDAGLQVFHDAETTDLGKYGAWVWRAPAGTVFTDVQANASLTSQAGHHGELAVVGPGGTAVAFGAEHNDFRVHSIHGEFTQFQAWLRCVAPGPGKPCGRAGGDGAHAYVRGVYLRTDDRVGPRLAITGGSLLGPQVVRGTRGLAFSATDVGSGIRKVYVEGNGQTVVTDIRNCLVAKGFATALTPCPPATTESAAVPTAASAFVTGPDNVVTACVEDLALDGAPNRACEERRVWVDNACPASPVGGGRTVEAGFGGGAQSTAVASDRPAVVRGRVPGGGRRRHRLRPHQGADRRPADRRRRDRRDGGRRLLRHRAPTRTEPRGVRPLRGRRPGARAPRARAALGRDALAAREPQPRRSQPRPPALHRRPPRAGVLRPCGEGAGTDRQAPLAGLPHGPRRRGLPLHSPLQAALDRAREALPLPRPRPAGGRLSVRARPLADREGQAAATPRPAAGPYGGSRS